MVTEEKGGNFFGKAWESVAKFFLVAWNEQINDHWGDSFFQGREHIDNDCISVN